jgi:hypothetical protein
MRWPFVFFSSEMLPAKTAALLKFVTPIKDGQLCWAAMGFCASALYEMAEPGAGGKPLDRAYAGYAQAGLIVLILAASVIAAAGAVFPTKAGVPPGCAWYKHYKALAMSLVLAGLSASAYTVVHFWTTAS